MCEFESRSGQKWSAKPQYGNADFFIIIPTNDLLIRYLRSFSFEDHRSISMMMAANLHLESNRASYLIYSVTI